MNSIQRKLLEEIVKINNDKGPNYNQIWSHINENILTISAAELRIHLNLLADQKAIEVTWDNPVDKNRPLSIRATQIGRNMLLPRRIKIIKYIKNNLLKIIGGIAGIVTVVKFVLFFLLKIRN